MYPAEPRGHLNRLFTRMAKTAAEGAGPPSMTCQTNAGIARAGGLPLQRQMRIGP